MPLDCVARFKSSDNALLPADVVAKTLDCDPIQMGTVVNPIFL